MKTISFTEVEFEILKEVVREFCYEYGSGGQDEEVTLWKKLEMNEEEMNEIKRLVQHKKDYIQKHNRQKEN